MLLPFKKDKATWITRGLAFCYLSLSGLFALDLIEVRYNFGQMILLEQVWTVFAALSNFLAAISLWFRKKVGDLLFVVLVLIQLWVFIEWTSHVKHSFTLVAFYFLTLVLFYVLLQISPWNKYQQT
jgi:hypothetical protein